LKNLSNFKPTKCVLSILIVGLFFLSNSIFSQDSSGPVLSAFSQDLNTVDITSGGVTLTIQITVTDSSTIASVSSTPSLTLSSGSTSITSGYQNFSNWSVTSTNSTLWSPSNISPSGWIDASDTSSYNLSGSDLSAINDKSGNFSMTIDGTPTRTTNSLNGLSTFYFDGGESLLSSDQDQVASNGNHWAIGVFRWDSLDNSKDSFWSFDNSNSNSRTYAISSGSAGTTWPGEIDYDGNNSIVSGTAKNPFTVAVVRYNYTIVSVVFNKTGNQIFSRLNGTTRSSVHSYDNNMDQNADYRLFRNRGGAKLAGRLAEHFFKADVPGTGGTDITDVEKAEGYLAHKWGLTSSLPSNHPYKSSAPLTQQVKTYSSSIYLDPDHIPSGNYTISFNHSDFVDENGNQANLPSGYDAFDIQITNNTSDPVLYFDPNNTTSYSESGNTVNDLTTYDNDGTLSNVSHTYPYFSFNGSSSNISVVDANTLEPGSGNFSVEAWVRFGALGSQVIVGKIDDGGNASHMGYGLRMDTSNRVRFEVGDGANSYNTSRYTSTTNRWYQFVGVVDDTNDRIKLYIDGTLFDESTSLTSAIKNTTTQLRIGSYNDNDYGQNLNGDVGVVRIYKRALSSADVEQNYKETVLTYAVISNIPDKNFTGSAITFSPTVTLNGSTLTEGVDYTTTFTNNINAGSASLTINGIGSYLGSKTTSFTIIPDTTAPSVTLSDTDDDNFLASSDTVTITARFNERMTATPTISITGVVTNVAMLRGTAHFTAADIDFNARSANSVYAADMDGDGDMDILSASSGDNTIAWYENINGDGSSWTATDIANDVDGANSVFAADMDGDGDMDILSTSSGDDIIAWYENDGDTNPTWTKNDLSSTGFLDGPRSVFATDIDGDGDMDFVLSSYSNDYIFLYRNNGAANPSWTRSTVGSRIEDGLTDGVLSVIAADMDGDGDKDIVSTSKDDNTIVWYENNNGNGSSWTASVLTTNVSTPKSVYASDIDGDGDMDIVSAEYTFNGFNIQWHENNGNANPSWTTNGISDDPYDINSVFAADMDGDGDMDIVSAEPTFNVINWYENNNGDGSSWTRERITRYASQARSVFAADMDGDGDMDIVSASSGDNTVAWYENNVDYNYTWNVSSTLSTGDYQVTVS
jgi:hypothetical protein